MRFATLAILAVIAAAPAHAECRDEVTAAFAKQRAAKSFRMEANVISLKGPMKMTVDYALPDRIRQKITFATQPDAPIEAVLVGAKAWANEGKGWVAAPAEIKDELERQLRSVAEETDDQLVQFECMGKQKIDGAELAAYRAQEGPKDLSKDADKKPKGNEMVRVIYIDPAVGLPVRSVVARPDALDKPLFKAVYAYPADLKIEPPSGN